MDFEQPQQIELTSMPQQLLVRDATDDWSGVTSTADRRRLQNRLNQRAYRDRHKKPSKKALKTKADGLPVKDTEPKAENDEEHGKTISSTKDLRLKPACMEGPEATLRRLKIVRKFAQQAFKAYTAGAPTLNHLPSVQRVNVFNALSTNASALGLTTAWLYYDAISPFGRPGPVSPNQDRDALRYPEALKPTELQRTVAHHPWLDLFPLGRMRDNFIRAIEDPDVCDEDALCCDLVEFGEGAEANSPSLIVWGEPWDPRGWEASMSFLNKWGWLLEGCPEILEGTNYWREKRGEKRLKFGKG